MTAQIAKTVSPHAAEIAPWPCFGMEEQEAVQRVLSSGQVNYWTGEEGRRFEEEFANRVACRYGVALANGTLALELALRVLGIGPGDEVITTCRSFIASASTIVQVGAKPVFVDVDRQSQNLTPEGVAAAVTPRTRAILAVHLAGWPCDMEPLQRLAATRQLKLIEDCSQAHGACYQGKPVGSLGDVATFSFCQDKIITTGGEGGMLTTNTRDLWERAWSYKEHGKDQSLCRPRQGNAFRWLHQGIGSNLRMTEMQAAIGRVALKRLPGWLRQRRANATLLNKRLGATWGLRLTLPPPLAEHAYYKYYFFLRPEQLSPSWSRQRILHELEQLGIPCQTGSCPEIYREQAFRRLGLGPEVRLRVAGELGETSMMLPIHPTLDETSLERFATGINQILRRAVITSRIGSLTSSPPTVQNRAEIGFSNSPAAVKPRLSSDMGGAVRRSR